MRVATVRLVVHLSSPHSQVVASLCSELAKPFFSEKENGWSEARRRRDLEATQDGSESGRAPVLWQVVACLALRCWLRVALGLLFFFQAILRLKRLPRKARCV